MNRKLPSSPPRFWDNFRLQALLLTLLAVGLYMPTVVLDFGYALDDGLVIKENPYTTSGWGGIDELLTRDAYQWYYDQFGGQAELSGGRYRPLSIITFAIEYALFGLAPKVSHAINVALYGATAFFLLWLLHHHLLDRRRGIAFIAVLLFVVHPLHAEVVANIKSRDELLSFLFLTGMLIQLFRAVNGNKNGWLWSLSFYFLALMSKENGITYLAVIPLALHFFGRQSMRSALQKTIPFVAIALVYLGIRWAVVGIGSGAMNDVLNDPFLYATSAERYATIFVILLKYLQLLVFPYPMSYDYGFATFVYSTFADWKVWLSILLHVGGGLLALYWWRQRAVVAFAILFYLITLSIISNLVVPLGATMGERLIYHSSFGFVLIVAAFLWRLLQHPSRPTPLLVAILLVFTVGGSYLSIARAMDWQNNRTLFLADVEVVPHSIKANTAAANEYIQLFVSSSDTSYLDKAMYHFKKAEALYPPDRIDSFDRLLFLYPNYLNQGYIHFTMGRIDSAAALWERAHAIKPFDAKIQEYYRLLASSYFRRANTLAGTNLAKAIENYYRATKYAPGNADYWYNLGGALFTANRYAEARAAFEQVLQIRPNHSQARQGLAAVNQKLGS